MGSTTKSRSFSGQRKPQRWTSDGGKTWKEGNGGSYPEGKQQTVSESHRRNPKTGNYESGGPFSTVLAKLSFPTVSYHGVSGDKLSEHISAVGTPMIGLTSEEENFSYPFSKIGHTSDSELNELGATAINLSQPLNSWANTGVALGEIYKDGLPNLPGVITWKRRTEIAKAAGSEYLNAVFGWLPLVSDVKDTFDSTRRFRDLTNRFRSQAGRKEPKRFDFPISRTRSESVVASKAFASPYIKGGTDFSYSVDTLANQGPLTRTVETETRSWFEGSFTYGIPNGTDIFAGTDRTGSYADKLFGLDLTPTLLWELTPWSWAVDWFSNAGDVISNFTSMGLQGLVMRYGYMMSEKTETITYSLVKSGLKGMTSPPSPSTIVKISKSRAEANPYGFGVSWDGLSPFQIAVAAALGITRLR